MWLFVRQSNDATPRESEVGFDLSKAGIKLDFQNGNTQRCFLEKVTYNPAVLLIAGFILTGVIGGYITDKVDKSNKAEERELQKRQHHYETTRRALFDFTKLIYERRVRAGMLFYALTHNFEPEEIKERKRSYDEIFVVWNATIQVNQFYVRLALDTDGYSGFESHVQLGLVPIFKNLHRCLSAASDHKRIDPKANVNFVENCASFDSENLKAVNCGYAITDAIFDILMAKERMPDKVPEITSEKNAAVLNRCEISDQSEFIIDN